MKNLLVCADYDNAIRWQEGERLEHLFEERSDQLADHLAVYSKEIVLTYKELDDLANQLARYLLKQGVKPGDRVGLLFDRGYRTYVALLAVLKVKAAYVPIDASFPQDRIEFILSDAGAELILTQSMYESHLDGVSARVISVDSADREVAEESATRLTENDVPTPEDGLCYIVYTSGSTGKPKGVAVEHPSICNFVKVAAEAYGITQDDRVYQGMTIAFDFSVEELWVPMIAGATLIPGKASLVGKDLADYLQEHEVTALCCVPTLLASIEEDLPLLRFLLVSGEACPHDLVVRWHREGRTILNAYGPTEATVTCTWTELVPDKPVTIGQPLPTYYIVILEEGREEEVEKGGMGEICVAGIGLAKGYVNRDDLTAKAFIPDFLGIPGNPSRRIYRTGDLGRITDDGEVEFHGRIDTQVKVRGYRIELTEIESVLLQVPDVAQAVVTTYAPDGGGTELAAFYTLRDGVSEIDADALAEGLRGNLPGYMVPAYIEPIDEIPMLPSNKADRKQLPDPSGPRFLARSKEYVAAEGELEETIVEALQDVLQLDRISTQDHFFEELGAHSLLMAQFCSQLRDQLGLADVSMRDIYLHPTVARLAEHLESQPASAEPAVEVEPYRVPGRLQYVTCGAAQLVWYALLATLYLWIGLTGYQWMRAATEAGELYLRIVTTLGATFAALALIPVLIKWLVVGRFRAGRFPVWSFRYFRFWVAKQAIQASPLLFFRGTPLYNMYLRLLGAKIGRNVVLEPRVVPVCTDLISIGENTVVRRASFLSGYNARGGWIHTGPVTLGRDAFVGESSVLEVHSTMEDGSQLGHVSLLQSHQVAASGKRYHGSPAEETTTNYDRVEARSCSTARKLLYSAFQLSALLLGLVPAFLFVFFYYFPKTQTSGTQLALTSAALYGAFVVYGLVSVIVLPRLFRLFIKPDRVYPLYGFHYWIYKAILSASNSKYLNVLFGDSSFIVYYLRWIGYKMNTIVQTGSNFGVEQKHDVPFLCDIGTGTMVADGLSMINAQLSATSFRVSRAAIGADNYLGNNIHYPSDSKTGDNCLLATKVMIPVDGPVRENVGLLGSPAFEIPRAVDRDRYFDSFEDEQDRLRRLRGKNWHNFFTVALFMFTQWIYVAIALFSVYQASTYAETYGIGAWMVSGSVLAVFSVLYFSFLTRASYRFKAMEPRIVSIYDKRFWQHERYWKLMDSPLMDLFKGTPLKNVVSRCLGIRVGKMVFDDGMRVSEKTLVEVGDYCTLNEAVSLQSHSLEEGVFKSDHIKLGRGCTAGVHAFVHYGVTMGDNVVLAPDSFLMKGETVETDSVWRGNPARSLATKRSDATEQ